ncbi:uncharacterized protein LOC122030496 [Zingiber officinale]|uniref:uncharacterized protein LOC122030496 n=1 Tax=Zingiber officinale TaxID=94328 RepID=UPI001C4BA80D|nr:uncharacterized protein LOC122030496 [Zingiber officinale]
MWLLFVLHKVFPPLFVLFLNSLPVIACTTLLLGVLLVHSEPNTRKHKPRGSRDRTRKDSVTEKEGLEPDSRATRKTVVRRVISSAICVEKASDEKDADSDEWHEIDQEQDGDLSDFKSADGSDVGETYGEKDGDEKNVVSWSEDDQRILIQIGNSELERNRRLERVIAIRKARRLMMVDNGGDKPILHSHLSSINASRKNPIEDPYDSTEPPGSATPSAQSPFDLPHDPTISKENSNCSSDSSNSHNECESISSEANKKPDATGADQFSWFALSLASVDEHESLSKEVSVIEEADVIGHEMYRARKGFGSDGPVVSRAVPAPAAAKKALLRSSVVSMRM